MLGSPIIGAPGVGTTYQTAYRRAFYAPMQDIWLAGGRTITGAYSRDPGNDVVSILRAGLLLGKRTDDDFYAPSVIGLTAEAIDNTETAVDLSAAIVTELTRRIGATGTFKITGPPTAAGTVRTLTATYSGFADSDTVTISALGVNEVQTVNLVTAGTAGNLRLLVQKTDGTWALTPNIAWSATDATLLSNANTALDTATGVSGGIVATAIAATDTDLGFELTYSGTGYAGLSWELAQVHTLFTSNTGANVVRTTTGVDGRFVSGSLIQPTDGSETIRSFVPDGFGVQVADWAGNNVYAQQHMLPIAGEVDFAQLLPAVSDASLIEYVKDALRAYGPFVFAGTNGDY